MPDGRALVFAQIAPHPRNAFSLHNVIGIDHLLDSRNGGHVPAHHDHRLWRELPGHAAHLAHLGDVDNNSCNADHVVVIVFQLARKVVAHGEVEHRAGRRNICLDHHDSPGAMKHTQREAALCPRHLIVIKLHWIDGAAAEFVVLRVRSED